MTNYQLVKEVLKSTGSFITAKQIWKKARKQNKTLRLNVVHKHLNKMLKNGYVIKEAVITSNGKIFIWKWNEKKL